MGQTMQSGRTCEFAVVALGIFAETLKNGVDARFQDTEKKGRDGIGETKNDKAGYRLKLFGVCKNVSAPVKYKQRSECRSERDEQFADEHDGTRDASERNYIQRVSGHKAEACGGGRAKVCPVHGSLDVCHFRCKVGQAFEDAHAAVGAAGQQLENCAVFVEPFGPVDVKTDDTS